MADVRTTVKPVEETKMSKIIREQFVRDLQMAGLSAGTQAQYSSLVRLLDEMASRRVVTA